MSLSTHVLDTSLGRPAPNLQVSLERRDGSAWILLNLTQTDTEGRVRCLLPEHHPLTAAVYRIRFETAPYFLALAVQGLYPCIEIVIQVNDPGQHHHIPLLLTPHAYTTYRGS